MLTAGAAAAAGEEEDDDDDDDDDDEEEEEEELEEDEGVGAGDGICSPALVAADVEEGDDAAAAVEEVDLRDRFTFGAGVGTEEASTAITAESSEPAEADVEDTSGSTEGVTA